MTLKEKPFVTDSIDQLLTYYALKALEFPAPVILTPQDACKTTILDFMCHYINGFEIDHCGV